MAGGPHAVQAALRDAIHVRFRPIAMSTLAAIYSLSPMEFMRDSFPGVTNRL